MPATPDELIDAWEAAWSGRDPEAFAPLCSGDLHYEDPLCGEPLSGTAQLSAHIANLWQAFPDLRIESTGPRLLDVPGEDARFLAAPCRMLATHRGEVGGVPASGRFLVLGIVFYCELEHGRLHRVRGFFDLYDAAMQLGLLPKRGTLGERALLILRGFGLRSSS